jgi:cytochrome b561
VLLALVAVHVAAALYHHFVKRDAVLKRMVVELKT